MGLYQQSLTLTEMIGNVKGQAATLAMMASLVGQQGEIERAIRLNLQAAASLAAITAYGDLATVLKTWVAWNRPSTRLTGRRPCGYRYG
ncbi:MAG: hypothetical protein HC929_16010 [Leptolyngbyaceae cyanobacterium SM2_5_2]|nr:hypothetical protein [Leptolyngbyaceae cyanobacterium SM2_5_2]